MLLRKHLSILLTLVFLLALVLPAGARTATPVASPAGISLLSIDGAIGPANADYIVRGIAHAAERGDQLVIIRMDTPGGLDTSMRTVIKAILASPVPVASYVAPGGARAASAGTYLMYASHVAAMAPGTNLGAATPVAVGMEPPRPQPASPPAPQPPSQPGSQPESQPARQPASQPASQPVQQPSPDAKTPPALPRMPDGDADGQAMTRKQTHDAAAYLRGLAQMRGRNADWAERAVRESVSLTANEALKQNVIDYVAADVPQLLAQLDGKTVNVLGQARRLVTRDAVVVESVPDWRTNALAAITNPSVALLLMTIGIYGLVFEFMNPGFVAPGVIGGICLLLGLYALQLLPVSYAGLALIVLGLMFMGAEAFLPSFGILGLGGIVAFIAGALMLIDTELPGYGIPPVLVGVLGVASALLLTGTMRLALTARRRPVTSGAAAMIGAVVPVETVLDGGGFEGWVRIEGETWKAVSPLPLKPAQAVKVLARKGLILEVVPVEKAQGV